ncbi:phosphatase PAP2 family protein [Planotetraspora thailandica]|nr:phosphatase PAP2 family protein [Planotetraspora thailandica]
MIPFTLLLVILRFTVGRLDVRTAETLHDYAVTHSGVTGLLIVWTDLFGPWPWRIVVTALAVWLLRTGAHRLAVWALATMAAGGLLGSALKVVVGRARPHLPHPVAFAPGESFPSGHALNATLGVGVVVLVVAPMLPRWGRRVAWALACFLALSVGYTRIALGVHWLSDVVAGTLLGTAVIAATAAAFGTWRHEPGRTRAAPPPTPPPDRLGQRV